MLDRFILFFFVAFVLSCSNQNLSREDIGLTVAPFKIYQLGVDASILRLKNSTNELSISIDCPPGEVELQGRAEGTEWVDLLQFACGGGGAAQLNIDFVNAALKLQQAGYVIQSHGGVVDKFIGDAIMATWGGLSPLIPQNADSALQACLKMREDLVELNTSLLTEFGIELKMGMGLNYGEAVVGTLGSNERMEFTSIGDAVNIAARVESLTKEFGCDLLVTEEYLRYQGSSSEFTLVAEQSLRGKTQKTKLYTFGQVVAIRKAG